MAEALLLSKVTAVDFPIELTRLRCGEIAHASITHFSESYESMGFLDAPNLCDFKSVSLAKHAKSLSIAFP